MNKGIVILVGAGPGDPGLLTLKGKEWVERADVVVYDHLANDRIIGFARPDAEIIYAGKKSGYYTLSQEEINRLLVDKARAGKIVIRLKGGDPFIFGRGGEEAKALKDAGIAFRIVPGISSPIGVSSYAGIPLTHREHSSSVSIITGSNEKGQDDVRIDWENIATRTGTLVFLMGARKLSRIVEKLLEFGKDPDTPVAVIQWGTTPRQKTRTGTLKTVLNIAKNEKIMPPALTIIGSVVNLKETVDWYESLPLFGKTVVVTRPLEQADSFTHLLRERGAEAFSFPVIQTVPPDDWTLLDQAMEQLADYYGVIFTSVNGVKFFMDRLNQKEKDIRELKGVRLYAIGPKTAQAVKDLGIRVDAIPEEFVAESLIEKLGEEQIKGKRFLLPRAAVARETLPKHLRSMGAYVDVAPAYQTLPPATDTKTLAQKLKNGEIDVISFTASSTVRNFMDLLGEDLKPHLNKTTIACIGPITANTAKDLGLKVDIVPAQYTVEGLVEALEQHFAQKSG